MGGIASVLYGLIAYLLFLSSFLYCVAFIGDLSVPKTIDSGDVGPVAWVLLTDILLLGLFAVQHSVMARPWFKRWWTQFVPQPVERSTFVLLTSLVLGLLFWQWRPITQPVWSITNSAGVVAIQAIWWTGWVIVFISTFLINHFELFGLRQVYARWRDRPLPPPTFRTPLLYKQVRHPLYLGFVLAFWAAPIMTAGHLLFAAATTGYILIGIYFEERDLIAVYGDQYRRYRERVSMLIPLPGRKLTGSAQASSRVGLEPQ